MADDVERQARELGWQPKEEFKGNPDNWVEAAEYVERGERFMPYLQADRRKLLGRVSAQDSQLTALQQSLEATRAELAQIKESTTAVAQERLKSEINQLRQQLREARREDDYERIDELEDQIAEKREAAKGVRPTEGTSTSSRPVVPAAPPPLSEEVREFIAENPWWEENPKMRAVATALSQQYQTDREFMSLPPKERLNRLAEETQEMFRRERAPAKVESTGRSSTVKNSGAHTYENLPSEAREACDKMQGRLVGEGKRFENVKQWRDHYAENYDWR